MAVARTPPPHAHEATPEHLASGEPLSLNSPLSAQGGKGMGGRFLMYLIPVLIVLALLIYVAMSGQLGSGESAVSAGMPDTAASTQGR